MTGTDAAWTVGPECEAGAQGYAGHDGSAVIAVVFFFKAREIARERTRVVEMVNLPVQKRMDIMAASAIEGEAVLEGKAVVWEAEEEAMPVKAEAVLVKEEEEEEE